LEYTNFKGNKISKLGFGFMRLPQSGPQQTNIDMDKTEKIAMRAIELGVNYFDSAYFYHGGKSEVALGEVLSKNGVRDKVNIATKYPMFGHLSQGNMDSIFEDQLSRLKTDYIDFYLLHGLRGQLWDDGVEKGMPQFLDKLKAEGRIRHAGFSFHDSLDNFKHIIDSYNWDFCQIQFNFMDVDIQAGLEGLRYAGSKGVSVVVMEPLKGGQLASISGENVDTLKAKYGLSHMSMAQIALRFVLSHDEVLTALSGMNEMSQVEENAISASSLATSFSDSERQFCTELKDMLESLNTIDCTSCRYCSEECPNEVAITQLFSAYNNAIRYNSREISARNMLRMGPNLDCSECRTCVDVCPQQLDIPELIKKAKDYFAIT